MLKFALCDFLRPMLRRLPRGSIRLLSICGGGNQSDRDWVNAPQRFRCFFDHQLGALVAVDLGEWGGRWYYYAGRYYDRAGQLLIRHALGIGDTYIDVGANLGVHSLLASKVVGPTGHVYAFEPHPETFKLLEAHLAINRVRNVTAHRLALADKSGTGTITLSGLHSGVATMRSDGQSEARFQVQVSTGNEVLSKAGIAGTVLLKIDVEGLELKVLGGMTDILRDLKPMVTLEVTPTWIKQMGSRTEDLFGLLQEFDYTAFEPRLGWDWRLRPKLQFKRLETPPTSQVDILFLPPKDLWRIKP